MKALVKVFAAALLVCASPLLRAQAQGEVGGYPNAAALTGNERILADQAPAYPCISCTVNLTPAQISAYLATSGNLFPAYVSGYLFWNGTSLVWNNPTTGGTVTSIGLTMPTGFSVSPSTITSSGTFAVSTALSGVLKGSSGAFTTAAAADVIGLWSGTCSSTTFLRGDGSCQTSGSVGTTGSPAAGNLAAFSGTSTITTGNLSGDCTTSGTLAVTCTKTAGVAFAPSATTDTTNASNIASGTLAAGRMPLGITAVPAAGQVLVGNAGGTAYAANTLSGDCTLTSAGVVTCLKVNGVTFAPSATTDTTNASNISSGTLGAARMPLGITAAPAAGQLLVGNSGGTAYAATSLSGDCTVTSAGVITCPKANGVTFAPSATTDTTNASNITSGTLATARMPLGITATPSSGQLLIGNSGGTAYAANSLSGDCTVTSSGVITCTKTNGTTFAPSATTDTTNATNIMSGLLGVARGGTGVGTLTGPIKGNGTSAFSAAAAADIYGLWSGSCSSTTFLRGDGSCQTPTGAGNVSNVGTPTNGQFAEWTSATTIAGETMGGDCTLSLATITCTKTSGTAFAASATTDATNASNIASGTLAAARMPALTGDCTTSAGTVATTCTKTNGTSFGTFATANAATPPAIGGSTPAAGTFTTLTSDALANNYGVVVNGAATSGQSKGVAIDAGTTSADAALLVRNQAITQTFLQILGDGGSVFGAPTGGDQGLGTINAQAVYVNGVSIGGTVTTSGSPVNGNLAAFSSPTAITTGNLSGDCTTIGSLVVTCLKTNGAPFTGFAIANAGDCSVPSTTIICTKTNGTAFGTFATANAATPPAIGGTTPSTGKFTSVTAVPAANSYGVSVTGSSTTNQSFGEQINAGTSLSDSAISVFNQAGTHEFMNLSGIGTGGIGYNAAGNGNFTIGFGSFGNVSISNAQAGTAFSVIGTSGSYTASFQANGTTGNSYGLEVFGGTNSSDFALYVGNSGTNPLFRVYGDGGIVAGGPSGGDQGAGTINATGLYVNGVAVAGNSSTGTFTGTLTGMTTTVTATFKYRLVGSMVTLWVQSGTPNGTSNSTALTLTGLPSAIQPAPVGGVAVVTNQVYNNGVAIYCSAEIIGGTITFAPSAVSGGYVTNTGTFTASGSKGVSTVFQISYDLEN